VISTNLNAGTYAGDQPYMAREIIKAAVDINTTYNNKVDVWSLGLTFAELLTGKLHEVNNRDDREHPIPYKEGVSKQLIDLCSLMIRKDTNRRPFLH
jgi:serine/threonine protein kinase